MSNNIVFGPGIDLSSKVPRTAIEFDTTSGVKLIPDGAKRVLLAGQMLSSGTFTAGVPVDIFRPTDTEAGAGAGSVLDTMAKAAFLAFPDAQITVLPIADAGSSTAATQTLTIATTATGNATLIIMIGNRLVQVGVILGDTPTVQAGNVVAAVAADQTLPGTATNAAGVVTFVFKNKGTCGNACQIQARYTTPVGSTAVVGGTNGLMAGGATDPTTLAAALAAGAAQRYHDIAVGLPTSAWGTVAASSVDSQGDAEHQKGEVAIQGINTNLTDCTNLSAALNDARMVVVGAKGSPSLPWEIAAAVAAVMSSETVPNRPYNTLPVLGIGAPPVSSRWIPTEQKTLIAAGVSPLVVGPDGSTMQILRVVSTRTLNASSVTDYSELDIGIIQSFDYIRDAMILMFSTNYARSRWADNNADGLLPDDVATPAKVILDLKEVLRSMEAQGVVQNVEANASQIVAYKVDEACEWSVPADIIPGLQQIFGKVVLIRAPLGA